MNLIDSDVLGYNNEPVGLEIIRLNSEIVHLSKNTNIKLYTSLVHLGVPDIASALDISNAMPVNSIAYIPISASNTGIGVKLFNTSAVSISPAILYAYKNQSNRTKFIMMSELFNMHRYIYSTVSNDTGWGGCEAVQGSIRVGAEYGVTALSNFNYDGVYYLDSSAMTAISEIPYNGGGFIEIVKSATSKFYKVYGTGSDSKILMKSSAATNWATIN